MTNHESNQKTTDFGFEQVPLHQKVSLVEKVFHSVADSYDVMNDLMSFGLHRYWKHYTLSKSAVRSGQNVLDLAGGSGDLTLGFCKRLGNKGKVTLADINIAMLAKGRKRLIDAGILGKVSYVQANAENLPFPSHHFDCISIGFGLRNVTDKNAALHAMYRTLKPGGRLLILEFSQPVLPLLQKLYDAYSFAVIPKLGEWVAGDAESYRYLVESIRKHPDQETLSQMMVTAGFEDVAYDNLNAGIVALHIGYKY